MAGEPNYVHVVDEGEGCLFIESRDGVYWGEVWWDGVGGGGLGGLGGVRWRGSIFTYSQPQSWGNATQAPIKLMQFEDARSSLIKYSIIDYQSFLISITDY